MRQPRTPRIRRAPMRASLGSFAVFLLIAAIAEPTKVDRAIYAWARRAYDRRLEIAQWPVELFGLPGIYIPLAVLLARALRRRRRRGGVAITNAALAGWIAVRLSRLFIHRPRPPRPFGRGPKAESTFPSGHTAGVTTLALVAARVLRDEQILTGPAAAALALGLPLVTGANRVYVREHWLTDVLAGWMLGGGAALAVLAVSHARRH